MRAWSSPFAKGMLFLFGSLGSTELYANQSVFDWWGEEYTGRSTSNQAACQLCHESGGGGNGWNSYGWFVRVNYRANQSSSDTLRQALINALRDAEDNLTDPNDASSPTYLEEIAADAQPGWREGEVNTIRYADETPNKVISPPPTLPCAVLIDATSTEPTCSTNNPIPTNIRPGTGLALETVASGFTAPVLALSAPGEVASIYVVEQGGSIWRVNLETGSKQLFLDFSAKLVSDFGRSFGYDERGLLGFAFHPLYATNGRIVTYISQDEASSEAHFSTLSGDQQPDHLSVVSEWTVVGALSETPSATQERELLVIDQPQFNHNGGMVDFGPDGHLYISLGDGGAANDTGIGHGEDGNGRDRDNPLGSILRIDIDTPAPANGRYTIPAENPFVGSDGLDEIYVYGMRNPYRFSFEPIADDKFNLYVGDVGQDAIEEINLISSEAPGGNYGWNYKEGSFFFSVIDGITYVSENPPDLVEIPPLIDPVAEYDHGEGISVIGGYVYQGDLVPSLKGKYVFGDWGRSFGSPDGRLFYLTDDNQIRELVPDNPLDLHVTGFGRDYADEIYVVGSQGFRVTDETGFLKKLVATEELCIPMKSENASITIICL